LSIPNVSPEHAGHLLKDWKEELKISSAEIAEESGLSEPTVRELLAGDRVGTFAELAQLAVVLNRGLRDMLPYENDLVDGVKLLRHDDARMFQQDRGSGLQYTYWARATSSAIPDFVPVELVLHISDPDQVVPNLGHFFHQYTEILDGGPVTVFWKDTDGETHSYTGAEGDTWLIPGFTPHWFTSPDPDNLGKIIACTIGQHLTGDTRQEIILCGADRVAGCFNKGLQAGFLSSLRQNRRLSLAAAATLAGIESEQLTALEAGEAEVAADEVGRLARAYKVSERDLMPQHDDLENELTILPMAEAHHEAFDYGVRYQRVATSRLPNIVASELRLNGQTDPDFDAFPGHTYLQVLRGPDVIVEWTGEGGVHSEAAGPGDTFLISAFTPYRVRPSETGSQGRVLELSMAQHLLNGDALREAALVGFDNLERLVKPISYYAQRAPESVEVE
jgi:transcriptional regulator with XRE-family HTH domain